MIIRFLGSPILHISLPKCQAPVIGNLGGQLIPLPKCPPSSTAPDQHSTLLTAWRLADSALNRSTGGPTPPPQKKKKNVENMKKSTLYVEGKCKLLMHENWLKIVLRCGNSLTLSFSSPISFITYAIYRFVNRLHQLTPTSVINIYKPYAMKTDIGCDLQFRGRALLHTYVMENVLPWHDAITALYLLRFLVKSQFN